MITGHTSPAVTRRPEFSQQTLPHSSREGAVRVEPPPGNLKNKVAAREANQSPTRKMLPSRSAAGLLLMDSSLNPISFNAEAIQILGYLDKLAKLKHTEVFLC